MEMVPAFLAKLVLGFIKKAKRIKMNKK